MNVFKVTYYQEEQKLSQDEWIQKPEIPEYFAQPLAAFLNQVCASFG